MPIAIQKPFSDSKSDKICYRKIAFENSKKWQNFTKFAYNAKYLQNYTKLSLQILMAEGHHEA